ncbi:MAG: hypothetical protein EBT79_13560 [Actinobacteria bacterium]|nr:hypothetical protein [Actinomycetota bacterium]
MCDWLMQDDGCGTVLNPDALTTRHDVFYNWPMEGNLTDHPEGRTGAPKVLPPVTQESRDRAKEWHRLFAKVPRHELEADIVQKAVDDPVFMAELVKNPRAAIESRTGLKIPDEVKLEVIVERPGNYKLVIPYVGRARRPR